MKKVTLLILILISSFFLASLDYINSPLLSEEYYNLTIKDDIFYGVTSWGLMIYNIEDKYNPVLLNKIRINNGDEASYISTFDNLLIIGGNCYSSTEGSSYIYDISIPDCPELITELQVSIFDCKISEQNLFIINNESWNLNLEIYNIEAIENPVYLSEIENVASFEIFGNILYTIARANQNSISTLKVYNIQEIENPILINEVSLFGNPVYPWPYMKITNDILYIDSVNRFNTMTLENPEYPILLGYVEYQTFVCTGVKFEIIDSYLFSKTNQVVDISNSSVPEIVGDYAPDWPPYNEIYDITVQDDYLYVANNEFGFYIMDLSDPLNAEMTAWHENFDYFHGVYIDDGLSYVASWYGGLTILDVTDPSNSNVLGTYPAAYYNDIVVDGNFAFVAADEGLIAFDVSNPHNPILLDINNNGGGIERLMIKDNLIFAVESIFGNFSIYNVENPNNIHCIFSTSLMENPCDLCIKDDYLFVSDANFHTQSHPEWNYYGGLRVFDISEPSNPELISTVNPDTTRYFRSIEIKGNYVFMGSNQPGIYVFDITNPQAPIVSSYINIEQEVGICDMEIKDNYLYTTSLRGKFIFDIEDINSIECIDSYPSGEYHCCWSISVDGNYIYESGSGAFNIFYTEYAGVHNEEVVLSSSGKPFYLYDNYPNPFNPVTMLSFEISEEYSKIPVSLKIYNIKGQLVKTLIDNKTLKSGFQKILWDGKNDFDKSVSSGVYFYKLSTKNKKSSIKTMLLLK